MAALQRGAAAMAILSSSSSSSSTTQVFRIGHTTSSVPCTSSPRAALCCCSYAAAAAAACSYAGRLLRSGLSPAGMQSGGIERIACGILKDSSVAGRISSAEDFSVVGFPSAFGRRDGGDPLFLVSDDYSSGGEGPIELPPREIEIDPFAIPDASPAQIVASIFLTGAIVVLSYRALRKRAARSKEMQVRSSGISTAKSIKEEARKTVIDNLTKAPEVPAPLPSPAQTLFGAILAGGFAFVLYNFTTTVEAGFSVKAVSQDYSIRNLTITVRTIITGLCYLATFVFAANSVGLTLYALQLLLGIGVSDPAAPPSDSVQKEESNTEERLETEDFTEK